MKTALTFVVAFAVVLVAFALAPIRVSYWSENAPGRCQQQGFTIHLTPWGHKTSEGRPLLVIGEIRRAGEPTAEPLFRRITKAEFQSARARMIVPAHAPVAVRNIEALMSLTTCTPEVYRGRLTARRN